MNGLDSLFTPSSIAVIGSSTDPGKIGGRPIDLLKRGRFPGPIFPINPRVDEVQGLRAYPSLRAAGAPVEQAIIALPAEQAVAAFEDCIDVGVKAVVMFSAGFADAGPEGAALQDRLAARAREHGIRLLGPNSLGLFNVAAGVFSTFTASLDNCMPLPGAIGMASQSGAFASYSYALAETRGLRFSALVATGNEAEIDVAACIEYLAHDPATRVIMAYIEGCRDGPALVRALRTARDAGKPVVILKVGTSDAGAQAAASHTGSLAGSDAVFDAVFRGTGAYRAHSIDELLDVAYAASAGVMARGRRLGVITTSGGIGVMLADAAAVAGLELPPLAEASQARIKAMIPFAEARNPVDTTAQVVADIALFARVFDAMLDATRFDLIVCFLAQAGQSRRYFDRLRAPLADLRRAHADVAFILSLATIPEVRDELESDGFLVFEDPARAARAAEALVFFGQQASPTPPRIAPATLPPGALGEIEAAALLAEAGVPMVLGRLARTADEAASHADAIGYPVVAKIVSPNILHKTEAGGVLLGLCDADAVRTGFDRIMSSVAQRHSGARRDGVLVAPHVAGGHEVLLGAKNDPVFGPVVVVGLGGILVELFAETALQLAPVDERQAMAMIGATRLGRLLSGLRGAPPCDVAGLARAVAALSRFAAAHADTIESIDINPCVVTPDRVVGLDALIVRKGA